jgi:hypothetical protein
MTPVTACRHFGRRSPGASAIADLWIAIEHRLAASGKK